MDIGEPVRKITVIPLRQPVPATPEPKVTPPRPAPAPSEPEKVDA